MSGDNLVRHIKAVHDLLYTVCQEKKVQIEISERNLAEVVGHYNKDMEKLRDFHQGEGISANKRVAGLAFWIRRIKPISFACKIGQDREIPDINEKAAVWAAHKLLIFYCRREYALSMLRDIQIKDKEKKFEAYLIRYWRISEWYNYYNLIYNLRYRNFSPHHLSLLFDAMTTGFCLGFAPSEAKA